MILSSLRIIAFVLATASTLHALPDISNLKNCVKEVRQAEVSPPAAPTFDSYKSDYNKLLADVQAAAGTLPFVYQEAAAKPFLSFLQNLGEWQFLQIFNAEPTDELSAVYQQIIPDAALAIIFHDGANTLGVNAFQEVVSDLYDSFLSEELRAGNQTGIPIEPPTYGTIPPLVKYGNAEFGPYTWTVDATSQILGMKCAIVSLPPSQIKGGLLAWSALGHETGGHDILHADEGLLEELAQKVYTAVMESFRSRSLANYWAKCIDETVSDVCGYLNMGPSAGIGLIGYFRALGNGKLRTVGYIDDTHPIDLLRGYLAASVAKRLHFQGSEEWSTVIANETKKDNDTLYLVDNNGYYYYFPVSLSKAIASADLVAKVIMQSKLAALQDHSLQDIQNWRDEDQYIVNHLSSALKANGSLPANLQGPGFYAAHVVAAATQTALEGNASISQIFAGMQNFLATMHFENPTWSLEPSTEAIVFLEKGTKNSEKRHGEKTPHYVFEKLPEVSELLYSEL